MRFSAELKQRRMKKQLTMREAAKETGISLTSISRFERGIGLMEMSAEKAQVLADFFRWNLKEMMRKMKTEAQRCKK